MSEGSHGMERLRGSTNLGEVLQVAMQFEASARDFYAALAPRVSKRIRDLVQDLAAEEQRHFDLCAAMAQRSDLQQQLQQDVQRTVADSRFSDCIHTPDLGPEPDDQAVLQYALGREQAAMQHYGELAGSAPEGPLRDLFRFLANEETQHKLALEKLYYERVHRGGGV